MGQHSWNSTVVVADIHLGIDTQSVHTAVDHDEVCSTRHIIYHNKHIHLTCIVTYMILISSCYVIFIIIKSMYNMCTLLANKDDILNITLFAGLKLDSLHIHIYFLASAR